jgi:hypothetical protein
MCTVLSIVVAQLALAGSCHNDMRWSLSDIINMAVTVRVKIQIAIFRFHSEISLSNYANYVTCSVISPLAGLVHKGITFKKVVKVHVVAL